MKICPDCYAANRSYHSYCQKCSGALPIEGYRLPECEDTEGNDRRWYLQSSHQLPKKGDSPLMGLPPFSILTLSPHKSALFGAGNSVF